MLGAGQAEKGHPGAELGGLECLSESESHAIGNDGPLLFSKDLHRVMVKFHTSSRCNQKVTHGEEPQGRPWRRKGRNSTIHHRHREKTAPDICRLCKRDQEHFSVWTQDHRACLSHQQNTVAFFTSALRDRAPTEKSGELDCTSEDPPSWKSGPIS